MHFIHISVATDHSCYTLHSGHLTFTLYTSKWPLTIHFIPFPVASYHLHNTLLSDHLLLALYTSQFQQRSTKSTECRQVYSESLDKTMSCLTSFVWGYNEVTITSYSTSKSKYACVCVCVQGREGRGGGVCVGGGKGCKHMYMHSCLPACVCFCVCEWVWMCNRMWIISPYVILIQTVQWVGISF